MYDGLVADLGDAAEDGEDVGGPRGEGEDDGDEDERPGRRRHHLPKVREPAPASQLLLAYEMRIFGFFRPMARCLLPPPLIVFTCMTDTRINDTTTEDCFARPYTRC